MTFVQTNTHNLAHDFRAALVTQQLQVVLQPKVCLCTHQVVGGEALLRWQHPTEGLIPADRWVSLAESHNLMRPLTVWLIDKILGYLKELGAAAVPLAVNVPPTILNGAFALHILEMLSQAGVAFHLLEIEITESTPVDNMTNLVNAVRLLQSKGIKVYLDDFGTGYSTMQYLVDMPVDGVKMDKRFVQQAPLVPTARLVLQCLIELAQEIGITVICEGVETIEQLSFVKSMGTHIVQGYLTGKPMRPEVFVKTLEEPYSLPLPVEEPKLYQVHAS